MSANDPNANRPGYKETKAGWIPEEWECVSLKSLGDLFRGAGITRGQLRPKGVPAVRYGDVYTTEGVALRRYKSFVDDSSALAAKPLCFGDIVFASSGETADEIGKSLVILTQDSGVVGGDTVILRPKKGNSYFLAAEFNTGVVRRTLSRNGQGQSVVHIYKSDLELLNVQFPPLHEQKKIAEILSTCDAAIEKTGALIEAKQRQKKSLMQQLLSGEKRLPGFEGEWQEVRLGDAVRAAPRPTPKPKTKFLSAGLRSHGKGVFLKKDFDPEDIALEELFEFREGDLVVNITFAWEGAVAIVPPEAHGALVSHRFPTYEFIEEVASRDFFRHLVISKRFVFDCGLASPGGAGRNRVLNKRDFLRIPLNLPPIEEQHRIAEILNACDREITLHRRQLEAIREQKRGLMQKLLTGEVRVNLVH